jgi:hypothetical protein
VKENPRFKLYDHTMVDLDEVAAITDNADYSGSMPHFRTILHLKGGGQICLVGKAARYIEDWQTFLGVVE